MTYMQLVEHLENRLGYHQMPVNWHAEGPQDLFETCPLHDGLTRQLMRGIFKRNRCQRLSDPVYQLQTEAVLTEIRNGVRVEGSTDIDRYHFVEDCCQAVNEFFIAADMPEQNQTAKTTAPQNSAQIIDFDRYRLRKLRWRA